MVLHLSQAHKMTSMFHTNYLSLYMRSVALCYQCCVHVFFKVPHNLHTHTHTHLRITINIYARWTWKVLHQMLCHLCQAHLVMSISDIYKHFCHILPQCNNVGLDPALLHTFDATAHMSEHQLDNSIMKLHPSHSYRPHWTYWSVNSTQLVQFIDFDKNLTVRFRCKSKYTHTSQIELQIYSI